VHLGTGGFDCYVDIRKRGNEGRMNVMTPLPPPPAVNETGSEVAANRF